MSLFLLLIWNTSMWLSNMMYYTSENNNCTWKNSWQIVNIISNFSTIHCCVNQPYWLKKNPSLLSYREIFFRTLKRNALVKEFSLAAKEKILDCTTGIENFFLFRIFSWNFYVIMVHSIQFFMLISEICKFKFEYFWNEHKKTGLNELMKYRNFKKKFEKKKFQTGCAT